EPRSSRRIRKPSRPPARRDDEPQSFDRYHADFASLLRRRSTLELGVPELAHDGHLTSRREPSADDPDGSYHRFAAGRHRADLSPGDERTDAENERREADRRRHDHAAIDDQTRGIDGAEEEQRAEQ